jgi:two-component system C4-dicarboxylate transport sensor histidine kinase DctB
MLNLFMNAIEAMQMTGMLTVQTQSLPDQDQILLSVMDTGPGISPDILPDIFEPFVTNKITGTGLGMTITRDIILQHHGEIQAENNPQGGAVFKIWLPIKKQELT